MVCYSTEQGLGYLAKSFYDAGVVQEATLVSHRCRQSHPEWYGSNAIQLRKFPIVGNPGVDGVLERVDLMLFFETAFDWSFLDVCKNHGVKTVCMPMHEWFPRDKMDAFNGYLCPSVLDVDMFPEGSPLFVPPVDPTTWNLRKRARRFLHNAGNVGSNWHKGTLEVLRAVRHLKSDLTLTVRSQDTKELDKVLAESPGVEDDPRVTIQRGSVPYDQLFEGYDALVSPEKYNGLSLPLQEARAAGLLVITTDRYPTNTWLPHGPMIPPVKQFQSAIGPGYLPFLRSEVDPKTVAKVMDDWYDADVEEYSLSGKAWAEDNSWATQKTRCLELLEGFLDG